jgi:hypothetical protein
LSVAVLPALDPLSDARRRNFAFFVWTTAIRLSTLRVEFTPLSLMKSSKRFLSITLAAIVGLGAAGLTALAASGDDLVTLCYRNRTIKVPTYLQSRYIGVGATIGPCSPSPR